MRMKRVAARISDILRGFAAQRFLPRVEVQRGVCEGYEQCHSQRGHFGWRVYLNFTNLEAATSPLNIDSMSS